MQIVCKTARNRQNCKMASWLGKFSENECWKYFSVFISKNDCNQEKNVLLGDIGAILWLLMAISKGSIIFSSESEHWYFHNFKKYSSALSSRRHSKAWWRAQPGSQPRAGQSEFGWTVGWWLIPGVLWANSSFMESRCCSTPKEFQFDQLCQPRLEVGEQLNQPLLLAQGFFDIFFQKCFHPLLQFKGFTSVKWEQNLSKAWNLWMHAWCLLPSSHRGEI